MKNLKKNLNGNNPTIRRILVLLPDPLHRYPCNDHRDPWLVEKSRVQMFDCRMTDWIISCVVTYLHGMHVRVM